MSDRFVREPECRALTGLSRSTRWRLERSGEFPKRRRLSSNGVGCYVPTWRMLARIRATRFWSYPSPRAWGGGQSRSTRSRQRRRLAARRTPQRLRRQCGAMTFGSGPMLIAWTSMNTRSEGVSGAQCAQERCWRIDQIKPNQQYAGRGSPQNKNSEGRVGIRHPLGHFIVFQQAAGSWIRQE